ncbi:hypothetical protein LIER_12829 [Lithospermum erythrorhizon]|uniref:Uncharacterized protein n=1 Tax=Lithospermum erythrorhizon TaxID=34254 RepID=A0AAV3PT83_LITER
MWSRAFFSTTPKCDVLLNNMCEVFNSFILDAKDKPVITMMNMVKDLIMMRMEIHREKAENRKELCVLDLEQDYYTILKRLLVVCQ